MCVHVCEDSLAFESMFLPLSLSTSRRLDLSTTVSTNLQNKLAEIKALAEGVRHLVNNGQGVAVVAIPKFCKEGVNQPFAALLCLLQQTNARKV